MAGRGPPAARHDQPWRAAIRTRSPWSCGPGGAPRDVSQLV